jgi:hypothetical protein
MLAKGAESESVKLAALRSLFSDVVAVSKFSVLKHRMAKIEAMYTKWTDARKTAQRPA